MEIRQIETFLYPTQTTLLSMIPEILQGEFTYPDILTTNSYIYAPGDIPVMLIAHLDTVHKDPVKEIYYSADSTRLLSPQGIGGDDRCGVYIIMRLLILGHRPHILFTTDEEIGAQGARDFVRDFAQSHLDLNYLIEFDRQGSNDCVFYDCDNPSFIDYISAFGFREQFGTFSDISIIAPAFKTAAVNLSSGYYRAHTDWEYIDLNDIDYIVLKADRLLSDINNAPAFEYIPLAKPHYPSFAPIDFYTYFDDRFQEEEPFYEKVRLMPLSPHQYLIVDEETGETFDDQTFYIDEQLTVYMEIGEYLGIPCVTDTFFTAYNKDGFISPKYKKRRLKEVYWEIYY